MELFALLLPKEEHKAELRSFAKTEDDDFARFLNLMMNDASMQLDEGGNMVFVVRMILHR